MPSVPGSWNHRIYFIVPVVLCMVVALYFPVLHAEYVWDDVAFFTVASDLRTGNPWQAAVASVIAGTAYFRPLVMGTLIAEARLLDANPLYSHLLNLLLHLANTLLVGMLAWRLARAKELEPGTLPFFAAVAMLLYGLHPALVEPVAWVSGRFDLIVTLFCLSSLFLSSFKTLWSDSLCALLFFAAALSKEMAVTFCVLLFLWHWALQVPTQGLTASLHSMWGRKRLYGLILMFGVAYLALRMQFMPHMVSFDQVVVDQLGSFVHRGAYVGLTLDFYLRTVAFPFLNMGPLHPFDPMKLDGSQVAWGWAVVAASIAWLVSSIWRATTIRLLLSAALISLLPVLNFVPLAMVGNIGHERFLVLPLAFFVLAATLLLWQVTSGTHGMVSRYQWRVLAGGFTAIWLGVAALNVHVTVPLWKNELVLWHWAYRTHPGSPYAQFSLAAAAINAGRFDVLEEVMTKAEKMGVMPLRLTVPYAQYLAKKGQIQEGIDKIRLALQGEPQPHLYLQEENIPLEDAVVQRAGFNPWFVVYAYDAMAQMQLSLRQFDEALESERIAHFYEKNNPRTMLTKSFALYGLGRIGEAEQTYQAAENLYLPRIVPHARSLRASFLEQLCSHESARHNPTCHQPRLELTPVPLTPPR